MFVGISPLRLSFAGGGTDMPEYYEKFNGCVVSSSISLFTNLVFNPRVDDSFQAFSPDFESHQKITDFNNLQLMPGTEIAVSVVKYLNYRSGGDYFICSDVKPGSGLGGSSSLSVNCVNTIQYLKGEKWDSKKIAETSFYIERNILNHEIGKQDNYITSFGGFNLIKFNKNSTEVIPILMSKSTLDELEHNLILFFLGTTRKSSDVLSHQLKSIKENDPTIINSLHQVQDFAIELYESLKNNDIASFANVMHKGWIAKKKFSSQVSNDRIDKIYDYGIKNGALGGKITGAGGGGHILFYCEKSKQTKLKNKMQSLGLIHIPFKFYADGPKVLNLHDLS